MKRENLQRAVHIENRLRKLEEQSSAIQKGPIVKILESTSAGSPVLMTIGSEIMSEHDHAQDARDFLTKVGDKIQREIDSLLKEMDGL